MSVNTNEPGRRQVSVEVVVPGTPEEVWQAIATGPGISSWFVPAVVDEQVGGLATLSFGPGMDSVSTITEWTPPHRMVSDSKDLGPDAPTIATQWIVEARDGGTCVVRVVHSIDTDATDWDGSLEAWEAGWPDFFRILKLYLTHFRGQFGELLQLSASTGLSPGDAWSRLAPALGVAGAEEGDVRDIDARGLHLPGARIVHVGRPPHAEELLLRTGDPTPGLAHWFALRMGEQTHVSLRFYLYGDSAPATAARAEPVMSTWLEELFATAD